MTNLERMTRFLDDVQGIFMQHAWPYVLPKVSTSSKDDGTPDDRLIDAHWKTKEFELLLSLSDGRFSFYGDDFGDVNVSHGDATTQDVAEALRKLKTRKITT